MAGRLRICLFCGLLALAGAVGGGAFAAPLIYRVNGTVTDGNYPALEAFLSESTDAIVGLKLFFESEDGNRDGQVQAYQDGDMFVAYRAGPDMETEIVAMRGVGLRHGFHVFDGFYLVKYGGLNQGITSLSLQQVDEAQVLLSGAEVKDIEIEKLDPASVKR